MSAGEGEGEEDVFLLGGILDECSLLGKRRYVCVIIYSERCSEGIELDLKLTGWFVLRERCIVLYKDATYSI